ncbi:DUF2855 family protein [Thermaurantiacus tibetensis]|uniref:DUF2855 family protein n=1 Tax=Thermaurantiacus tibetensis TaxID=2759035 RepID=UPI00188F5FE6|nr:DUF2855 family protein [Thermaurantiacus tibetensis]
MGYRIETAKADLTRHRVREERLEPAEGEAIARVDLAAVTANNVTYAVHHGPPLFYGAFFPAAEPDWLVVPLWGFGTVVASRAPGVEEGTRVYGYWPSASHLRLVPRARDGGGFTDMAAHRQPMAAVYNGYVPAAAAAPTPADEPMAALFRPLFGTAFALDAALAGGAEAGPDTFIFTSASSKTALGTAWCLRKRGGHQVIGLTSPRARAFVEGTGLYDSVLTYEALDELPADLPATLVDFAGNGAIVQRLHRHLRRLAASHIVGDTHWQAPPAADLPGPKPALFFAPAVMAEMSGRMGPGGFQAALAERMAAFLADASRWLEVRTFEGPDGFAAAFDLLVEGRADPAVGAVWQP